jgi:hypothetical protein
MTAVHQAFPLAVDLWIVDVPVWLLIGGAVVVVVVALWWFSRDHDFDEEFPSDEEAARLAIPYLLRVEPPDEVVHRDLLVVLTRPAAVPAQRRLPDPEPAYCRTALRFGDPQEDTLGAQVRLQLFQSNVQFPSFST